MRYHDRIVCALAGLQAQRRVAPQSVKSRDANGDEAIAAELLLRLHGEEKERNCAFKYLEARARNLVNHRWRMVEDLAKALLERQSLTGKEVGDVLRASLQAQMQEPPEANTMNNKEYLEIELRYSVQKLWRGRSRDDES